MNDPSEASKEAAQPHLACVVMKFGGTSVEDAAAIRRLCQIGGAAIVPAPGGGGQRSGESH